MRTADLKFGDKVVIGQRDRVKRGQQGTICLVLDRGNFRETYTPCGKAIVSSPASDARVVVAVPYKDRDAKTSWKAELKHHSSLYPYEEFRLAVGERKKREVLQARWDDANSKWVKKLDTLRKKVLGLEVWHDARYVKKNGVRFGRYVDCDVIDFNELLNLLTKTGGLTKRELTQRVRTLRAVEKEYAAWLAENPNPGKCRIPS